MEAPKERGQRAFQFGQMFGGSFGTEGIRLTVSSRQVNPNLSRGCLARRRDASQCESVSELSTNRSWQNSLPKIVKVENDLVKGRELLVAVRMLIAALEKLGG
jgi:hypothetical protein